MKKKIYIFLAVVLVVLVQFLLHVLVEAPISSLLVSDFEEYNLGMSWQGWFLVHNIFSIILFLVAIPAGLALGAHWYRYIYEDPKTKRR